MNLEAAKSVIMRDRLDWNKPHLQWLPGSLYRFFAQATRQTR